MFALKKFIHLLVFEGGERTKDEMCLHMFPYYPRMSNLSSCITLNSESAWKSMMNTFSYVQSDLHWYFQKSYIYIHLDQIFQCLNSNNGYTVSNGHLNWQPAGKSSIITLRVLSTLVKEEILSSSLLLPYWSMKIWNLHNVLKENKIKPISLPWRIAIRPFVNKHLLFLHLFLL